MFEITLDPNGKIIEQDEFNNTITYSYNLESAGTVNLFPSKFSILSELNPEFLVQSGNAMAGSRGYRFELDSTVLFAGGFTQAPGPIAGFHPVAWLGASLLPTDTTAYYWRTKYDVPEVN